MRHGSLFSGIGGFDLAAEWMGWENVFHCEWKEFNKKILKYYWPNAISYTDITKTDFSIHRGAIDILTGGFPCQPYSVAGKRKGKEDDRHLWPEMLRAIREIQPAWIVGENVRGLVNWNGGMVFEEVQSQMENEGYEVQPFLLPACSVGAPHRRDRLWFIANSTSINWRSYGGNREKENEAFGTSLFVESSRFSQKWPASNSNYERVQRRATSRSIKKSPKESEQLFRRHDKCIDWEMFPTQSPVCNGNDGFSSKLDGITFSRWRKESIMSGGNAIVPQVALQIFKAISQI